MLVEFYYFRDSFGAVVVEKFEGRFTGFRLGDTIELYPIQCPGSEFQLISIVETHAPKLSWEEFREMQRKATEEHPKAKNSEYFTPEPLELIPFAD